MEILYGRHSVREALRARRRKLIALRLRGQKDVHSLEAAARAASVPVQKIAPKVFDAEAAPALRGQSALLQAGALPLYSLEEILAQSAAGEGSGARCLVALDGVQDPQNLGAVARSAVAAGAQALLQSARRAAPPSPAASRASAGALEHLPVARVPNLGRALAALKREGFWVLGADPKGGEPLFGGADKLWRGDLVLVLGAEGRGLRPGVSAKLDHRVRIPMAADGPASLNVAAAAALLLYERLRRVQN